MELVASRAEDLSVTTLTAKAARFSVSFSGHARRYRPRSLLKAPSEPEYVLSRVRVPVLNVPARDAHVSPYRQGLWDTLPAMRAYLRRESSRDLDNSTASALSLALEYLDKFEPPGVVDGLSKVVTSSQPCDVEVFDRLRTASATPTPQPYSNSLGRWAWR